MRRVSTTRTRRRPARKAARKPARPRSSAQPGIAVLVDPPLAALWRRAVPRLSARVREAAAAALKAGGNPSRRAELTIYLAGDAIVRDLNRDFRGKDKPTNVLSFPASADLRPAGAPVMLGDVIIAHETVVREAAAQGKSVADHLIHLIVHGVLHLLGYDHEKAGEARRMEAIEVRVLAGFGIADPYAPIRRRA